MRTSIRPQIVEYKNKFKDKKCEICCSEDNIQVDHHNPQFVELYSNFLKQVEIQKPTYFIPLHGSVYFKEDDKTFKNEWFEYHEKNSTLRLLCSKCNNCRPRVRAL